MQDLKALATVAALLVTLVTLVATSKVEPRPCEVHHPAETARYRASGSCGDVAELSATILASSCVINLSSPDAGLPTNGVSFGAALTEGPWYFSEYTDAGVDADGRALFASKHCQATAQGDAGMSFNCSEEICPRQDRLEPCTNQTECIGVLTPVQ